MRKDGWSQEVKIHSGIDAMFEVRCKSPMDDNWLSRERVIFAAAGFQSCFSGASSCRITYHSRWVKPLVGTDKNV